MQQSIFTPKFGEYKEEETDTQSVSSKPNETKDLPKRTSSFKENSTSSRNNSQERLGSDSDVEGFEDLTIRIFEDEAENSTRVGLEKKLFGTARKITRCISETKLNLTGYETVCSNCQKSKLVSGKIKILVNLEEQLTQTVRKLDKTLKENQTLYEENQKLLNSGDTTTQKSVLAKVWNYGSYRSPNTSELQNEIKFLNTKISEYKAELQKKNQEIENQEAKLSVQRRNLKKNFSKQTEIQKNILEEISQKCKRLEEQINVEGQLRIKREAEISDLHNYIDRKEKYYRNQIVYHQKCMKRMDASHGFDLAKLTSKIDQKDKEIAELGLKCENIMAMCKVSNSEGGRLDKIKIGNLEQDLEMKVRQLKESNAEIERLEEDLKAKGHELEQALSKLSKSNKSYVKIQLEDLKLEINKIVSQFEEDELEDLSNSSEQHGDVKSASVDKHKIRIADKEEVE